MTCIAFDGKTIAAEGIEVDDQGVVICRNLKKLVVHEGVCLTGAGSSHDVVAMTQWWIEGRKSDLKGGCISLVERDQSVLRVIYHDGKIEEYYGESFQSNKCYLNYREPPVAWGAGKVAAMAAMKAGADARRAVEIACEMNINCGGDIQVVTLEDLQASWNASHPEKPIDFQPPDPRIDALLNAEAARAAHIAEGGEWKDFDPSRPLIDRQVYLDQVRLSSLHEITERVTYRKIQEDDKSEGVKEDDVPPEGGGL